MLLNLKKRLERLEELVSNGQIDSFVVHIEQDGFLIEPAEEDMVQKFELPKESMHAILNFFQGVKQVSYRSFDYDNLRCMLRMQVLPLDN